MIASSIFLAMGAWQIVLIVLVVLLIFGGKKIPELMRGLGSGIKEFKTTLIKTLQLLIKKNKQFIIL